MIEHPLPDVAHRRAPPALHQLAGLVCTGYGSVAGRSGRAEQPALATYGVLYLHAGSGRVETSATAGMIAVEAGTLVWLFPGVARAYTPDPQGWSEQWAVFDGPTARSFELLGLVSRSHPVLRPRDPAQVAALFTQLRADFAAAGPLAGLLGAGLIYRLVALAQVLGDETEPAPPTRTQAALRAVALIEARALQPIDPRAVAAECGVGYSTLRRRFKQETGRSLTDYLLHRRLGRARELLAGTSLGVAEVARAVGFVDPYYFSRQFRREEGVSPTAYRWRYADLSTP